MTCSVRNVNELQFAVFTNSAADYQITACSVGLSQYVRDAVDHIARSFQLVPMQQLRTAVGVLPIVDDTLLAYRVFNVGEFRNRPDTLGVVGVAIPKREARPWTIAQALAGLKAPVPDSSIYELPASEIAGINIGEDGPLALLEQWELKGMAGSMRCCIDPPGIEPRIGPVPARSLPPTITPVKKAMSLLALVVLSVAVLAMLRPPILQDVLSAFRETPKSKPTKVNDEEEKRAIRLVLQGVLPEDDQHLSPAIAKANLQWIAASASNTARKRMTEMRKSLERTREAPRDQYAIIKVRLTQWAGFNLPGPTEDPPADFNANTDRDLGTLRCYRECAKLMDDLSKSSDDDVTGNRFADGVHNLMLRLGEVGD